MMMLGHAQTISFWKQSRVKYQAFNYTLKVISMRARGFSGGIKQIKVTRDQPQPVANRVACVKGTDEGTDEGIALPLPTRSG